MRQSVENSVVLGDVFQVDNVTGDVTITTQKPPYSLTKHSAYLSRLTAEQARRQPAKMLLARYGVVPFVGRATEMADLRDWLDAEDFVSVLLLHGPGGQGKTRLAMRVADECASGAWDVWWAHQGQSLAKSARIRSGNNELLVVVDYADRWMSSNLVALIDDLHSVSLRTSSRVRVLLLGRSANYWWPALCSVLDGRLTTESDSRLIGALSPEVDRQDLYLAACQNFADRLECEFDATQLPMADLSRDEFKRVLALHMLALVAVDAPRLGQEVPRGAASASEYLLRREYAYWQQLHSRPEGPIATPPSAMRRAVFLATISGARPRSEARRVLSLSRLTETAVDADRVIDDHRLVYPPEVENIVLQPLQPDLLGEDFVAMSIPGAAGGRLESDDWTQDAVTSLVNPVDSGAITPWRPSVLTTLIETSYRWPHIKENLLYPLLMASPTLAYQAGGVALARIAGLPDVDRALLKHIAESEPPDLGHDFAAGLAAISASSLDAQLSSVSSDDNRADILDRHAWRLAAIGQRREALEVRREVLKLDRALFAKNPVRYGPKMAVSLSSFAEDLSELGDTVEALALKTEALKMAESLSTGTTAMRKSLIVMTLTNLGIEHSKQGRHTEAARVARRAVRLARQAVDSGIEDMRGPLSDALGNLTIELAALEDYKEALRPAKECLELELGFSRSDGTEVRPSLARAYDNLSRVYAGLGSTSEAVSASKRAVEICRELDRMNSGAFRHRLAMVLGNLGVRYREDGDAENSLQAAAEAVEILRWLAIENWRSAAFDMGVALNNLGTSLRESGRLREAIPAIEEATSIFERLSPEYGAAAEAKLSSCHENLELTRQKLAEVSQA